MEVYWTAVDSAGIDEGEVTIMLLKDNLWNGDKERAWRKDRGVIDYGLNLDTDE